MDYFDRERQALEAKLEGDRALLEQAARADEQIGKGTAAWMNQAAQLAEAEAERGQLLQEQMGKAAEKGCEAIETGAVSGYQAIEKSVVGTYQKIEDGVVGAYRKIEDGFVDAFLTHKGETAEQAKERLARQRPANHHSQR